MQVQYPKYEHECWKCVFLGTLEYGPASVSRPNPDTDVGGVLTHYVTLGTRHADARDLYYCTQDANYPTVIARFGDGALDYKSGMLLSGGDIELGIAKQLAEERGLIDAG